MSAAHKSHLLDWIDGLPDGPGALGDHHVEEGPVDTPLEPERQDKVPVGHGGPAGGGGAHGAARRGEEGQAGQQALGKATHHAGEVESGDRLTPAQDTCIFVNYCNCCLSTGKLITRLIAKIEK